MLLPIAATRVILPDLEQKLGKIKQFHSESLPTMHEAGIVTVIRVRMVIKADSPQGLQKQ